MLWDQTLSGLFIKVGFTRWPLLLCSILGVAIIAERLYYFSRLHMDYTQFSKNLFRFLGEKKIQEALEYCSRFRNPVARLASLYIEHRNNYFRENILSREASYAMENIEQRLRGLASITHIAPLLGLLGTVTGLVGAFYQIQQLGGQVQAENLAGGIWEALLSTVFGLVIAIPCMAAYHGFESRADKIARRMQFIVSELDELFGKTSTKSFYSRKSESSEENLNAAQ